MNDEFMKDGIPAGLILKSASVDAGEITPEDLKKINKFTLTPVKAEEVFVFKAILGDNESANDRNFEPFNLNALKDMSKLYVGKPVIKDHRRTADNMVARVYDTELISDTKTTTDGEVFAKLVAKCYMIRTASNADLIAEINGGIKREVSTSCVPKRAVCSVCGVDNMAKYCQHFPGREYNGKTCVFTLDGAKDVHELSFVAVPAQIRAGTTKHYGPTPEDTPETDSENVEITVEPVDSDAEKSAIAENDVDVRIRAASVFLTINN